MAKHEVNTSPKKRITCVDVGPFDEWGWAYDPTDLALEQARHLRPGSLVKVSVEGFGATTSTIYRVVSVAGLPGVEEVH